MWTQFASVFLILHTILAFAETQDPKSEEIYPKISGCFKGVPRLNWERKVKKRREEDHKFCQQFQSQSETLYKQCILDVIHVVVRNGLPKDSDKPTSTEFKVDLWEGDSLVRWVLGIDFRKTKDAKAEALDKTMNQKIRKCCEHNFVAKSYLNLTEVKGDNLKKLDKLISCVDKAMVC